LADITQAYRQAIVNYLRGAGAPTAISNLYIDIFNGDPQGAGTSVLLTVTGSATRPSVASALGAASAASPSVSTNASLITLSASASGGATVSYIGLYDAATGGNLVGSHALTSGSQTVTAGNPVTVPASGLSISI
jgi:hypothetical protein